MTEEEELEEISKKVLADMDIVDRLICYIIAVFILTGALVISSAIGFGITVLLMGTDWMKEGF